MRPAAEPRPEIVRERPQVGSLRAPDEDSGVGRLEERQPGLVDVHRARNAFHFLARAGQLVQPFPFHLACGIHRRGLLDQADEGAERLADAIFAQCVDRPRFQDATCRVLRVGDLAEADGRFVLLFTLGDESRHLGGGTDADGQHAGRGGIQRSGVTDPLYFE